MNERFKKRLMLAVNIFNWVVLSAFAVVLVYFGNWIFISDKFIVPTESMSPTLIPGDRIVVNKLIFGARIYKNFDFSEGQPLVSWRMPGLRKIRPNDVLVFNVPRGYGGDEIAFKINYVFAKRCVGAPGDTVEVDEGLYKNNRCDGPIGLSARQACLAATPDSLIPDVIFSTIPFDDSWNVKRFGPLYVPAKGDTIRLDERARRIYGAAIEYETGRKLSDVPDREYVFRQNYYFMGGDNVFDSADSRYWGFVPEEFIIGVTRRIAYSRDRQTDTFRWDRFMKRIDR